MGGVDGIFIGHGDLSASMGHVGSPSHHILAAIDDGVLARGAEHLVAKFASYL